MERKKREGKPKLVCPTCGKQVSFLNSSTFKGHPAIQNWVYCFDCDKCMKLFDNEEALVKSLEAEKRKALGGKK